MKIVAAALILAQARSISDVGIRPVVLLDDLASEFDALHRQNVLECALSEGSQVWITGTTVEQDMLMQASSARVFHVEQGTILPA